MNPTFEAYDELYRAFQFYNEQLFEGQLPPCLITLSRQHDSYGYFSANQFVNMTEDGKGQTCHEITLNPIYFAVRSIPENLMVMVREMVSMWQLLNGKPPRKRYRNIEWGDKCESLGLMPSDTGQPGGKRVGDGVLTYIIDGGPFDVISTQLIDGEFRLSWADRFPPALPPSTAPVVDHRADGDDAPAHKVANADAAPKANPLDQLMEVDKELDSDDQSLPTEAGAGDDAPESASKPVNAFKAPSAPAMPAPSDVEAAPRMKVFEHLPQAALEGLGIEVQQVKKTAGKNKYCCVVDGCKSNVWAKPGLRLFCGGTEKKPHNVEQMVFHTELLGTAEELATEEAI